MLFLQDITNFHISTDLDAIKSECMTLSNYLNKQMEVIASLNEDIEESKKRLLEIQFNATIASLMYNVYWSYVVFMIFIINQYSLYRAFCLCQAVSIGPQLCESGEDQRVSLSWRAMRSWSSGGETSSGLSEDPGPRPRWPGDTGGGLRGGRPGGHLPLTIMGAARSLPGGEVHPGTDTMVLLQWRWE